MAAPTRSEAQILADRARIAELYLQGRTQASIAADIGMTQQMVSYDLRVLSDEWYQRALLNMDELKAKELAKIDNLEQTYWDAWLKSTGDKVERSTESVEAEVARKKATMKRTTREGNPAFLEGVKWCIERRCKLLGLDKPVTTTVDWSLSDDDLLTRARAAGLIGEAGPSS